MTTPPGKMFGCIVRCMLGRGYCTAIVLCGNSALCLARRLGMCAVVSFFPAVIVDVWFASNVERRCGRPRVAQCSAAPDCRCACAGGTPRGCGIAPRAYLLVPARPCLTVLMHPVVFLLSCRQMALFLTSVCLVSLNRHRCV